MTHSVVANSTTFKYEIARTINVISQCHATQSVRIRVHEQFLAFCTSDWKNMEYDWNKSLQVKLINPRFSYQCLNPVSSQQIRSKQDCVGSPK